MVRGGLVPISQASLPLRVAVLGPLPGGITLPRVGVVSAALRDFPRGEGPLGPGAALL